MQIQSKLHFVRTAAVVLATLGCSLSTSAAQVTWEFKGEVRELYNENRLDDRDRPDYPPAVETASIPFAVGDAVRLLVTYDSSSPATFNSGCSLTGTGYSQFQSDPITGGSFSIGQVIGSIQGGDIWISDCAGDHSIRFQGLLTGPQIEDLQSAWFAASYASQGCFTAGSALPASVPNPTTCPLKNDYSYVGLQWDNDLALRFVITWAALAEVVTPADEALTPTGSEVTVQPVVTLPRGDAPVYVHLTFDAVSSEGTTIVTASADANGGAETAPPSFKVGDPPIYYDVETTASFVGSVNLCFPWQDGQFNFEEGLALFHFENGVWQNVTTSLDPNANIVCGQVSSLSPFAVFAPDYAFSGFYQPVDNLPIRNKSKAGSAIPVKFSLNGNQGLEILAPGYPRSQAVSCSGTASDPVEETATAGASGLSYDASADLYTYVWKTNKVWANSCRRLTLKLNDGSVRAADFEFTK